MSHYAHLSKCCSAPCLVRGSGDGDSTRWFACGSCKEPTDRKRTVLDTKEKLKEFLDSRSVWSYTASTTLEKPRPCIQFRHLGVCASITGIVLVLSVIFVLLAGKAS